MKVHYYEQEGSTDLSYRDKDDASWVTCGKHIGNDQVTINEDEISCGSCLKITEREKAKAA